MIKLDLSLDREDLLAIHNFMHGSLSAWMNIEEELSMRLTDALSAILRAHPIGTWIGQGMTFLDPHGHPWTATSVRHDQGRFVAENTAGRQALFGRIGEELL